MFQMPRFSLDNLNKAILFAALIAGLMQLFFPFGTVARTVCTAVFGILVAIAVFRIFSQNREKRYTENQKYLTVTTAIYAWFRLIRTGEKREPQPKQRRARKARKNPTWNEIKHYKYLICPQCTQRLRVPRGKGKLRVTCTRCGKKFETKS